MHVGPAGEGGGADSPTLRERVRGCLLGGALGDALGAPIEFLSIAEIRARFGPEGVERPEAAYGRAGAITDDTQKTLFTVSGLIRAWVRAREVGAASPVLLVAHAYRRWLHTQGVPWDEASGPFRHVTAEPDGWLVGQRWLHARRSPGHTCIVALAEPRIGSITAPLNDARGCGGVIRVAPVGLLSGPDGSRWRSPPPPDDRAGVFRLGCEIAALTHGHPDGYLGPGVMAAIVHGLVRGEPLEVAVARALETLRAWRGHETTLALIEDALSLAARGRAGPESLYLLGGGWTGPDVLAIAIASVFSRRRPAELGAALRLAANHSGNSDSTASICGQLLGALHGERALPGNWLAGLEGRETVEGIADDFVAEMTGSTPEGTAGGSLTDAEAWSRRYPAW
jgi:ADP-ribosylglycohydrolase